MPRRILIFLGPDFQDAEVLYPYYRFKEAGFEVVTAGLGERVYKGKLGYPIPADIDIDRAATNAWDAVIIPGGWAPDKIRMNKQALAIVRKTMADGKVVGAICHGGWVLASADCVLGRTLTSYIAIKDDLVHAGATWVDEEVVRDNGLVTSRKPDDLPAFCRTILQALDEITPR